MKSELTASDSYKEVSESISSLGVMLGQEDSNWIAIDYRDTHAGVVASKAVARTKDGKLYVSSQHFCGFFAAYSNLKQLWELEYPETTESNRMELSQYCDLYGSEGLDDLVVLESTQDPKLQEQLLFLLGFKMDSND
ncbi:MAG: hypothetical protein P1U42_07880 [Phycisphaerales bacterium]|nr:hypothetical protein [Phycisphaerales bacterium]